jgi:hypothetical protein
MSKDDSPMEDKDNDNDMKFGSDDGNKNDTGDFKEEHSLSL